MGLCNEKSRLPLYQDSYRFGLSLEDYEKIPIVSLDEAIEPLVPSIPTLRSYVLLVKQKYVDSIERLTSDQSAAIMLYSMVWQPINQCLYTKLNDVLSLSDRSKLKPWYFYLKLLFSALIHLPSHDHVVYRGSKSDLHQQYSLDAIIQWSDLSLCTDSMDHLQSDTSTGITGLRTICTIRGNTVKDIRHYGYHSSNHLMLFLPGTKFQVIGSFHQTNDLHYMLLKEIEPSFLLHSQNSSNRLPHIQPNRSSNRFNRFWPLGRSSENVSSEHHRTSLLEHRILQRVQSWTVDLDKQNLTDQDMVAVVKYAIVKNHCKRIRLRANQITGQGCVYLAEGLEKNNRLESFDLCHNQIGDAGVQCLAMSIASSNIKTLNLEGNNITADSAEYLAQMLQQSQTLTELYLSKNHLGDRGVELISRALIESRIASREQSENSFSVINRSSLQHLYLGENEITDLGVSYLSDMLKMNQTLTWLWLSDNQISHHGVQLLSTTLIDSNITLEWLFLNSNPLIDDQCVDILLHMLRRNNSLKTLYINNCHLSEQARRTLSKIIKTKNDFDLEV